jgi:hypothetical protein
MASAPSAFRPVALLREVSEKKAAFLVAALILSFSSPAFAFDGLRDRYVYYDRPEGEIVGYVLVWCDNSVTGNGYPTPYYDEEHFDCP